MIVLLNQGVWRRFQWQQVYFWNKRDFKERSYDWHLDKEPGSIRTCCWLFSFPTYVLDYNTYFQKASGSSRKLYEDMENFYNL